MTRKRSLFRDGKFIRDLTELDDGYIMADGESIRFPMQFMDSAPQGAILYDSAVPDVRHRPGQVTLGDHDRDRRQALIDAERTRLSNAWQNAPSLISADHRASVGDATVPYSTNDPDAAWARNCARLSSAWRGA